MKFVEDFKKFAFKGNVVDMAVGVIIGGAFGSIVTSLVNDLISPFISLLTGNLNFADLKWILREAVLNEAGEVAKAEVAVKYGAFLQTVLYFFLVAISIFIFVSIINKGRERLERKKKEEEAARLKAEEEAKAKEPKKPTTDELLVEIRDLLAKK